MSGWPPPKSSRRRPATKPCRYDVDGQGCQCSAEGTPKPARRWGYCDVHSQRIKRMGTLGPPGHRPPGRPRQAYKKDPIARAFLELPPRVTWGGLLVLRPGMSAVQWSNGTRQLLPWPTLQAWLRRRWVVLWDRAEGQRVQQLDIAPGARAAARRFLETSERNRAKYGVRIEPEPGSDEA